MNLLLRLFSIFQSDSAVDNNPTNGHIDLLEINPATSLPMVDGIGGVDIGGNTYCNDDQNHYSSFDYSSDNSGACNFDPVNALDSNTMWDSNGSGFSD